MPRTEPVGPTLAKQVQDTPRAAAEVDNMLACPDPYFVELDVGIGRQIGNLAFEPRLLSFGASKQIIVRLRHSTLPLLAGNGCGLTFASMRQSVRAVNCHKAHLPPARDPFRSRDAEDFGVQVNNAASLWVVSYPLVALEDHGLPGCAASRSRCRRRAHRRAHQRWPFPALRREGTLGNPSTRRRHHLGQSQFAQGEFVRRLIRPAGRMPYLGGCHWRLRADSRRSSLPPGTTGSGQIFAFANGKVVTDPDITSSDRPIIVPLWFMRSGLEFRCHKVGTGHPKQRSTSELRHCGIKRPILVDTLEMIVSAFFEP